MILPFIAAGAVAAGGILQGRESKKQAEYEAKLQERNAAIARDQANVAALQQQRAAKKTLGSMRAAYGAAGVTVEGSPLDVLEESAGQAELDRLTILHNGELKAEGYEDNAAESRRQGRTAQQQALFGAVGTLFGSYGARGMPSFWGGS